MSTAPVLSHRALQELLKGNQKNFVSVRIGDELFLHVHRPVAIRFSPVWERALQSPNCGIVTVTFPPDPPTAPLAIQTAPDSDSVPPPPPPPPNRDALKFIVQWMEQGGADPKGKNAVPYPKGYRAGLEKLLAIASMLEVGELMTRIKRDLGETPVPKPRKCSTCRRIEHPGKDCKRCWECKEVGHQKWECPKLYQQYLDFLGREARRKEKAQWQAENEARQREWQEKIDREKKQREDWEISKGLRAQGANGSLPLYTPAKLRILDSRKPKRARPKK